MRSHPDPSRPRCRLPWRLFLALLLVGSAIILWSDADRGIARRLWSEEAGWRWAETGWVLFLYRYGPWLAGTLATLGGGTWLVAQWAHWRAARAGGKRGKLQDAGRFGLFLGLLFLLGPGLMVNWCFKEHMGRARPRDVDEFGGHRPFVRLGEIGPRGGGKSFPSGHASTGFFWLGVYVYFHGRNRKLSLVGLAAGVVQGSAMGAGRMLQGGHWLSDVLWSAGMVHLSACGLRWAFDRTVPRAPQ